MNLKWQERFLELAKMIASWSKDPSTKVGAVVVDNMNRIIGVGYNGFPRDVHDTSERYNDKSTKYKLVVHAEINAVLNSNRSVEGCYLVATKFPCSECTKVIIQSGVTKIFSPAPLPGEVWTKDAEFSKMMLQESYTVFEEI